MIPDSLANPIAGDDSTARACMSFVCRIVMCLPVGSTVVVVLVAATVPIEPMNKLSARVNDARGF
ncbi:hypothetical protein D3C76_1420360 [compost metagenome]